MGLIFLTFFPTKEQQLIQSLVQEFARKLIAPSAAEQDRTKAFPKENLTQMAGGVAIPKKWFLPINYKQHNLSKVTTFFLML